MSLMFWRGGVSQKLISACACTRETLRNKAMAIPIPTKTEVELTGEVEVIRGGKVTKADMRTIAADTALAVATKFGGDKLIALFEELAKAECVTNGGKRIPDNRTRLAVAVYLGNHILGTPTQRIETVSVNVDADNALGLEERLRHSPALRSMFRKMLDNVEGDSSQNNGSPV